MLFCPGREPIGQRGDFSFTELIENPHSLEKEQLFFPIFPTNHHDPGDTREP
jgi:hypothetical protein